MRQRPVCRLALAVVATVALIFLIGEKLSDYWRGFIAGLIYLSFCGTFLLARIVMPEPLGHRIHDRRDVLRNMRL
jgi:hypothetical protein